MKQVITPPALLYKMVVKLPLSPAVRAGDNIFDRVRVVSKTPRQVEQSRG